MATDVTDRMTVYLNQETIKDAKHAAIEDDRTLSELVQEAVEHYLERRKKKP